MPDAPAAVAPSCHAGEANVYLEMIRFGALLNQTKGGQGGKAPDAAHGEHAMLYRPGYPLPMLLACFWSLFILAAPVTSRADIALSFIPTEEAKFLIKGEGLEGIASVALIVNYDTSYLSAPQVTVMGGGLRKGVRPDATPGRLRLDILTEEQSSAFEACIFFQKQGDFPVVINFVTAEATDLTGAQQPVPVAMMANPNAQQPNPIEPAEVGPASDQKLQTAQKGELEK